MEKSIEKQVEIVNVGGLKTAPAAPEPKTPEFGGPQGPEPTRYGDWERNGRVSDF